MQSNTFRSIPDTCSFETQFAVQLSNVATHTHNVPGVQRRCPTDAQKVQWQMQKNRSCSGGSKDVPFKGGETHAGVYAFALLYGAHAGTSTCTTNRYQRLTGAGNS